MRIHQLSPAPGSKHNRKRIGRGDGSRGTTAGKGTKGQKARAGGGVRLGFEGGQNPAIKRMPYIRGFNNIFKIDYAVVNLAQIARLGVDTVTVQTLAEAGLIPSPNLPVKVLGDGEIQSPITVHAARFSGQARAKIEAVGGRAEATSPSRLERALAAAAEAKPEAPAPTRRRQAAPAATEAPQAPEEAGS